MEHNQTKATQKRVVLTTEVPEEIKKTIVELFPEVDIEFPESKVTVDPMTGHELPEPQLHNRRSTDKVAVEKPSIETQHVAAAKVLRGIADKRGLCFTQKEIEALTLLGDTFSPNFAAICAGIACLRYNELGWV